ncbi:hypothetical protein WN51_12574, partial [Melipona quadrifasciata]
NSNRMAVLLKFGREGAVKDIVYSNDASGIELSGTAHSGKSFFNPLAILRPTRLNFSERRHLTDTVIRQCEKNRKDEAGQDPLVEYRGSTAPHSEVFDKRTNAAITKNVKKTKFRRGARSIPIDIPRRQSVFRSTHAQELVSNEAMKRGSD